MRIGLGMYLAMQSSTKVSVYMLSQTLGQIAGYMKAANLKYGFVSTYE